MDRQEAIEKLSTIGHISVSYAEDLYDSFFPKPVVSQCVADWYEGHKDEFEVNLFQAVYEASDGYTVDSTNKFWHWLMSEDIDALTILVNMHQFGYEVEEEKQYTVKIKAVLGQYLGRYYLNNEELTPQFTRTHFIGNEERPTFTRKELEEAGFGEVFNSPLFEVKEVE